MRQSQMTKQLSVFAMPRGAKEPAAMGEGAPDQGPMPDMDDPRMMRAMSEGSRHGAHG